MLTKTDLSGQKGAGKDDTRMPTRRRKQVDPLTLEAGDYIIHRIGHCTPARPVARPLIRV
ncbi:hypothetical protein ACIQMR_31425 [Streptomyces sp. NPDC091376]|uniref:hypothetical protein n=1 Tax=Streptomyces sp. NPDC091376 TaxID=3365994 RepID=UPI003825D13B